MYASPVLLRVLVSADDEGLRRRLVNLLAGPEVLVRLSDGDPVESARQDPIDVVVVGGSHEAARTVAEPIRRLGEPPEVVAVAEDRDAEAEAITIGAGASAVLFAGLDDAELAPALEALLTRIRETRGAAAEAELSEDRPDHLVVDSQAMKRLLSTVDRLSKATTACLILGETGVGKERIASLLHERSSRADGPFIALNCAAIPAELVEGELFGHDRGAFTGAHKARRGYFELAHRGSLFLDEVGELPMPIQAKLLRVLQDKRIRPIGSDRVVDVDVRVIAATNRDLEFEMAEGRFRRDLFYRLSVVELEIPPLRERPEDIEKLLSVNLRGFNARFGRDISGYSARATEALLAHGWPGNIRELINVVERAVLLCLGTVIGLEDLPKAIAAPRGAGPVIDAERTPATAAVGPVVTFPEAWLQRPWRKVREDLLLEGERAYLSNLLAATGGRIGLTASHAGMAERSLFEKMKRHGLRKEDFRTRGRKKAQ